MAARVNASLWTFREELQRGLEAEGHRVQVVEPEDAVSIASIKQEIDQIRQAHQETEAQQGGCCRNHRARVPEPEGQAGQVPGGTLHRA